MIEYTEEEILECLNQLKQLEGQICNLHDNELLPFSASDAKNMIAFIKHLALKANYYKEN